MNRIAIVMMLGAALAGGGCDKDSKGSGAADKANKTAGVNAGEKTSSGERKVAVEVGRSGYTPARIEASGGEKLVLAFTRTADTECGRYIKVASGEPRELPLNQTVEIPIDVPQTGEVRFVCGMDMMAGAVVVAQK